VLTTTYKAVLEGLGPAKPDENQSELI